jgi:non-canonical (house-cleaning) NTP pyrophosphatase
VAQFKLLDVCHSRPTGGAPFAHAETVALACTTADGSRTYRIEIDLAAGLVFNEAGYAARRWAAVVSDKDVTWDEVRLPQRPYGESLRFRTVDRRASWH